MKAMKGKANPGKVNEMMTEKLERVKNAFFINENYN